MITIDFFCVFRKQWLAKHKLPPFFRCDWDPAEDVEIDASTKDDMFYFIHMLQVNWKRASGELHRNA
jgi:hypothetical protein